MTAMLEDMAQPNTAGRGDAAGTARDTPRAPHRATADSKAIVPPVVYLLADHLDAVLARGEDLLAIDWSPDCTARCAETIADVHFHQRRTIDEMRSSEMALVSRALKAQERARELAAKDYRFRPMARLFAAGTVALAEAAREAGDQTAQDFETGDGLVAYLRSRALLSADAATLDDCGSIRVSGAFLVVRRIELAPLLDLVAMFLDTLELHYDLYEDLPEQLALPAPAIEPEIEAELGPEDGRDFLAASARDAQVESAAADGPTGDGIEATPSAGPELQQDLQKVVQQDTPIDGPVARDATAAMPS